VRVCVVGRDNGHYAGNMCAVLLSHVAVLALLLSVSCTQLLRVATGAKSVFALALCVAQACCAQQLLMMPHCFGMAMV
jgi:hypothetical protein